MRIVNDSSSKVFGIVFVQISRHISLQYALFVPDLTCSLLSDSNINVDLNCSTKLFFDSCLFQKLESGKKMNIVDLHDGLFHMRIEFNFKNGPKSIPSPSFPNSCYVLRSNKENYILL